MSPHLRTRVDSFRGNIENPILRYHISDRKITTDTFQADQTIPTLYNGNRLRINKYSSGVRFISEPFAVLSVHYFKISIRC